MAKAIPRIAAGVEVVTKKKPVQYGTIKQAIGQRQWLVEFKDRDGTVRSEELSSAQLAVNREYYNKPSNTPVRSALKTIRKKVRATIGRGRRQIPQNRDSSRSSSSSSRSSSSSDNFDDANYEDKSANPSPTSSLATPRPLGDSPINLPRQRQLFASPSKVFVEDVSDSDNESAGSFDDAEVADEDGDGTDGRQIITAKDDGGEEVEFIDRPMKKAAYDESYRIMKEEKKRLIDSEHTITKTVKSQNKYTVGGRVVGASKSVHDAKTGSIAEVVGGDRYRIDWDDEDTVSCVVDKKYLRLQKETGQTYHWKVVADHIAPNPPTSYEKVGIIDFSTADFNRNPSDPEYNHPFFRLVETLWPGDWRAQLAKMNEYIRQQERDLKMKVATEDEWWTFFGILIFAAKVGKGGVDALFDREKKLLDELPKIDFSNKMKKYRFEQLKKVIPTAFYGNDEADPWNAIRSLIDGFNNKRARRVAASFNKVYDESMSAWKPRTTKAGGLPFLSFILRKPKPIGTEFKVVACAETGKCFEFCIA
jgi:hypothetical protein